MESSPSLWVVPAVAVAGEPDTFAVSNLVDDQAIPPEFYGQTSYASVTSPEPRLSRREAMQAGPVKRSRDLIAGTLGTLPLVTVKPDLTIDATSWLQQPERNFAPSVTMTRTVEDMLFEGIALWSVTERAWSQFPAFCERVERSRFEIDPDPTPHSGQYPCSGGVYIDGQHAHDRDVIRFDSPNDPLLVVAATAIRQFLRLKKAGANASDGAPPIDYFTPTDGIDPGDPDEIRELLDLWQEMRRRRSTGYIPAALTYNVNGWDPEKLQLSAQVSDAVVEIARHAGIDSEELGVSTTSRTYFNAYERRKSFLDFTLGAYRKAIEGRLSMGDVTARGTRVWFDTDDFSSTDPLTRYQAAEIGQRVGAVTAEETRAAERKPPILPTTVEDVPA